MSVYIDTVIDLDIDVEISGATIPLNKPRMPSVLIVVEKQSSALVYEWVCILVLMESSGNPAVVESIDEAYDNIPTLYGSKIAGIVNNGFL